MNDPLPLGWGFAPRTTAGAHRPVLVARPVTHLPHKPHAPRKPRPWWQLSAAELAIADQVRAVLGWISTVRGVQLRDQFGVKWATGCRVARYLRAEARDGLPPDAIENEAKHRNNGTTTGKQGQ